MNSYGDESLSPARRMVFGTAIGLLWLGSAVYLYHTIWAPADVQARPEQQAVEQSRGLVTKPIKEIQVGDRVLGRNPLRHEVDEIPDIEPALWREVHLVIQKDNGRALRIRLLRPQSWIETHHAEIGGTVVMSLPEMGAVGDAVVVKIAPCPKLALGDGNVVTGKFIHEADGNLVELHIEGELRPICCTDNHPFWSKDRQEFVPAGELNSGEWLKTAHGYAQLERLKRKAGGSLVYNLEVYREHVFLVGETGTLVHNTYSRYTELTNKRYVYLSRVNRHVGDIPAPGSRSGSPSELLGNNMMGGSEAADAMRSIGKDAHHIVPWKSQNAQAVRDYLLRNGFTMDEITYGRFNGVWVQGSTRSGGLNRGVRELYPDTTWHKGAVTHASKHSRKTMDAILVRISRHRGNKLRIMEEIIKIGREMQDGTFSNIVP